MNCVYSYLFTCCLCRVRCFFRVSYLLCDASFSCAVSRVVFQLQNTRVVVVGCVTAGLQRFSATFRLGRCIMLHSREDTVLNGMSKNE